LPLHIFEERYKLMIAECMERHAAFGIVFFNGSDIQTTGCTASILKVLKRYHDGRLDILTHGEKRLVLAGCEGFSKEEKQQFLEMTSTYKRLRKCGADLEKIIERTKITSEIRKIIGGNGDMASISSKSVKTD